MNIIKKRLLFPVLIKLGQIKAYLSSWFHIPKKILIISAPANGVGNTILYLPVLKKIRESYPNAEIIFSGSKLAQAVLENSGLVDKFHPAHWFYEWNSWKCLREIQREGYDLVIETYPGYIGIGYRVLLSLLSWASYWATPSLYQGRFFSGRHETKENFWPLQKLGRIKINEEDLLPELNLTNGELKLGERLFNSLNIKDKIVIGMHIGSGEEQKFKRWPLEYFKKLISIILGKTNVFVLLFGGKGEVELNEQFVKEFGDRIINVAGKFTLRQTASIIRLCDLFLSNDSGLMHLASAVGCPIIAIFGPTSEEKNKPLGEKGKIKIITAPVSCRPCYIKERSYAFKCADRKCLNLITPEIVWKEIEDILKPK